MSRNQLPIMQLNKKSLDALDANTKAVRELTEELRRQRTRAIEGARGLAIVDEAPAGTMASWISGAFKGGFTGTGAGGSRLAGTVHEAEYHYLSDSQGEQEDADLVQQAYERGKRDATQAAAFDGAFHPGNQGLAAGSVHPGIRHGGHEETFNHYIGETAE